MAPRNAPPPPANNALPLPLADYFFICGLETSSILTPGNGNTTAGATAAAAATTPASHPAPAVTGPIAEDADSSTYDIRSDSRNGPHENPTQRHDRFSYEVRKSISSTLALEDLGTAPASNRSSGVPRVDLTENRGSRTEQEFELALKSFASERDSFLDDINATSQFKAGQIALPHKPRPKPKTSRISEDLRKEDKSVSGIRRKLSTINPLSRSATQKGELELPLVQVVC